MDHDPVSKLWIKVTISGLQYYSTLFIFFKFFFYKPVFFNEK